MVPSTYYCTVHFPHVTLQPIGFILWPLGPFDPFFTCNNFTVWFFKATGHIRLYWRNLVNTDSISRLVSYRDNSRHCLWKSLFLFPFRYWTALKIDYLRTNTVVFLVFFCCIFCNLFCWSDRVDKCSGGKHGMSKNFLPGKNSSLWSLCLYLLNIPAIIYPEDYCPCLLVIKSCDKMNTPIKWIKSPIVSSPSLRVGPLYYHVYAAPSPCKLR